MNTTFETAGLRVFERGWLSSNSVLFDGGSHGESVLIDSGYCTHAAQTVALVRNALGDRRLDRIVNTHLHSDHCGGNYALQAAFDCMIDVPAGELDKVDRWDEAQLTYRDTGQRCPRFMCTGSIRAGDEIRCGDWLWQVIATPGHDPESIVLYQQELKLRAGPEELNSPMRVDTAPEGEDIARENWSKHEQETPPHALSGIQGQGGTGRRSRRQDAGRAGATA